MNRIWQVAYPPGVPAEIDVNKYASINAMLSRACRRFAGRPAFTNFGVGHTHAEVGERGAACEPAAGARQHGIDRSVLVDVDFGRHTRRIGYLPDSVHSSQAKACATLRIHPLNTHKQGVNGPPPGASDALPEGA